MLFSLRALLVLLCVLCMKCISTKHASRLCVSAAKPPCSLREMHYKVSRSVKNTDLYLSLKFSAPLRLRGKYFCVPLVAHRVDDFPDHLTFLSLNNRSCPQIAISSVLEEVL
jgi:hypothetical protein